MARTGEEETQLDKKRAFQIGGAFFTRLFMPLVTDRATDAFSKRSSPLQRAKWLGLVFHHLGYRLEGQEGYDVAKVYISPTCRTATGQPAQIPSLPTGGAAGAGAGATLAAAGGTCVHAHSAIY